MSYSDTFLPIPVTPRFQTHDLRDRRRVLVIGDIHGCYSLLRQTLRSMGYDPFKDALISLGDLIDRGPENLKMAEWADNMIRITGNHEHLFIAAVNTNLNGEVKSHKRNGGSWAYKLPKSKRKEIAETLWKAPAALELLTPAGHKIGIVHASVPGRNWTAFADVLTHPSDDQHKTMLLDSLWCRKHIRAVQNNFPEGPITGIDHVFFGHTILPKPLRHENCTWVDTHAHHTKNLTVLDIDDWLATPNWFAATP